MNPELHYMTQHAVECMLFVLNELVIYYNNGQFNRIELPNGNYIIKTLNYFDHGTLYFKVDIRGGAVYIYRRIGQNQSHVPNPHFTIPFGTENACHYTTNEGTIYDVNQFEKIMREIIFHNWC